MSRWRHEGARARDEIEVNDVTLRESGKVGLWAPSATIALFDETLPNAAHPLEL